MYILCSTVCGRPVMMGLTRVDPIPHLSGSPLLLLTRAGSLFANEIGRQGAVTPTGSLTHENETLIRTLGSKMRTGEGLGGRGNGNEGGGGQSSSCQKTEWQVKEGGWPAELLPLPEWQQRRSTCLNIEQRLQNIMSGLWGPKDSVKPAIILYYATEVVPLIQTCPSMTHFWFLPVINTAVFPVWKWQRICGCSFKMPSGDAFLSDCGIISPLNWFYLTRHSVTSPTTALLEEPGALSALLISEDCGDLRQPRTAFHLMGKKPVLGLCSSPILQGVLVPSARGPGGNTSLWAPSSVPASSLSCHTGYQTGIPASTRLRLRLTCWQTERGGSSYLWMVFYLDSTHLQ